MRLSAAVVLAGLLAALPACRPDRPPRWPSDGSLTVALASAPIQLDPRIGTDQSSQRAYQLIVDGLVTRRPDTTIAPDLAERWETLDGGLRWRFHLRPGVRFQDGRPLSSADVVYTFGSILDGTVGSAKKGAFAVVERVAAVDPLTVDFVLKEPFGALLSELTSSQGIVPVGMTPERMNADPIGTGAFRLARRGEDRLELVPFAGHWAGAPALRRVVLREVPDDTVRALELLKGSVQLVVNDLPPDLVPLFRHRRGYRTVESPSANFAYLGFNLRDPALADVRVRRAIALAIDRPRLVATVWRGMGIASEGIFVPGHWAYDPAIHLLPHDPAAARRLLDEAGLRDPDGDGPAPRLRLVYKTSTSEPALLQAQVVQSMLADAGIAVEIRSYEFATFYDDIRNGRFQMFSLVRTGALDPHLLRLTLHSQSLPPVGQNRGFYRSPELDALLDRGARLSSDAERRPIYLRAQEIVARDLPYLVLYVKTNVAVAPDTLEGYENHPGGELLSLAKAHWRDGAGGGTVAAR